MDKECSVRRINIGLNEENDFTRYKVGQVYPEYIVLYYSHPGLTAVNAARCYAAQQMTKGLSIRSLPALQEFTCRAPITADYLLYDGKFINTPDDAKMARAILHCGDNLIAAIQAMDEETAIRQMNELLTDGGVRERISSQGSNSNEIRCVTAKYALTEFILLTTGLIAGTSECEEDTPFVHGLRLFLSEHTAYCGGYLLWQLGAAQRLWNIPRTSEKGAVPDNEVSIEIDLIADDLIDMTITIPVPEGLPAPRVIFDDRYARGERALYLNFQEVK